MTIPLLATKLFIPPANTNRISRPHLLAKLDGCLHPSCRLALVSAPAGFGKTTLVSTWAAGQISAEQDPPPLIAWLSLDEGDNDPMTFWAYLISALQTQAEGGQQSWQGKQALALLQQPQPAGPQVFLPILINELAQIPSPFILILDDLHLVRNPAVYQWLAFLIEHAPGQFHLLAASRSDPPLPLALLRGRGQLLEIRLPELRFSDAEAEAYLNDAMKLTLSAAAVDRLNGKTEGWAAGLQMAALALQGLHGQGNRTASRQECSQFIDTFSGSNRYILEYLLAEVLDRQPPEIVEFLMRTSVLSQMCASLCEAVISEQVSVIRAEPALPPDHAPAELVRSLFTDHFQQILETLDHANLFLISLDSDRRWYRYHHLFADLLQRRLKQVDPGSIQTLHARASVWYEENGLLAQSVDQAFRAGDKDRAAALLDRFAETFWRQGTHTQLLDWLNRLPMKQIRAYPCLLPYQAAILAANGNLPKAEECLQLAENCGSEEPIPGALPGRIAAVRAVLAATRGQAADILRYARQALDQLPKGQETAWQAYLLDMMSTGNMIQGNFPAAYQNLIDAIAAAKSGGYLYVVLDALPKLVMMTWFRGQLRLASQQCLDGVAFIEQNDLSQTQAARMMFLIRAFILCEQNDLDQAETFLTRAQVPGYLDTNRLTQAWLYHAQIPYLVARGRIADAETVAIEAEQLGRTGEIPLWLTCMFTGALTKIYIRSRKIAAAEELLHFHHIRSDGLFQHPHEVEFTSLAYLLLAKGDLKAANDLFTRLLEWAKEAKNTGWAISLLAGLALVYHANGDDRHALETLDQALEFAEPEGFFQTFLQEGEAMADLLSEIARRGTHRDYALRLLAAFPVTSLQSPAARLVLKQNRAIQEPAVPIEPLSEREIKVITFIAAGLSNKEIAQRLCVSLRTVKYHTTSIYIKLNVNGRAQAAIKAKELGLIE